MNLSYEEFIKLLPEGTKEYVEDVLRSITQFIILNRKIYIEESNNFINEDYKIKTIFSEILSKNNEYSYIAKKIKNVTFIDTSDKSIYLSKSYSINPDAFNLYKEYFLIYNDISYYYGLTPLELVNNIFNIDHSVLEFDDSNFKHHRCFIANDDYKRLNIDKIIEEKRKEFENNLSIELFRDTPIDIIHLITNASKIYNYNIKHIKGMLYKSIDDLIVDSIFTSYLSSEDTDIKNMIKKLNLSPGIIDFYRKQYLENTIELDFKPNYYSIKMYYEKYYKDLNSKTIENMFINLFNRNITNSTYVEELLNKYNIDENKIISLLDTRTSQEKINEILTNFNGDKTKLARLSKVYSLTLKKVNPLTNKYLNTKNDILTYSYLTYLSIYEQDNILYKYLKDNDVTIDKINNLVEVNLTNEEIENEPITLEAVKDIISKNIDNFDEYFIKNSKSNTLINIFNSLSNNKICNLNSEIENYMEKKELEYKDKIYLELFNGLNNETISFIKHLAFENKYLSANISDIDRKDLIMLSIMHSAFNVDSLRSYLYTKYDIAIEEVNDLIKVKYNNFYADDGYRYDEEDNIMLYNDYYDFIFKGYNQDMARQDIMPQHIFRNIFNKSLYNRAYLVKLLHNLKLNLSNFDNFTEEYDNYLLKIQVNNTMNSIFCSFNDCDVKFNTNGRYLNVNIKSIIESALAINTRINKNNLNLTNLDKEKLSIMLSYILTYSDYIDAIDKDNEFIFGINTLYNKGITLELICKYLNTSKDELKFNIPPIDYKLFDNYMKYFDSSKQEKSLMTIMSNLFNSEINNSNILSVIGNLSTEQSRVLNIELSTFKPYIPSLSECIDSLKSLEVKQMDVEDINDMMSYGNELSKHFVTINEEEHKLLSGDSNDKSIANINEIITNSYEVIEPKKSFFKWLFLEDTPSNNITIKLEAIPKLKEAINTNINILSSELLTYDKIRKYIIEYAKKNREYVIKTSEIVALLESKTNEVNPNDPYSYIDSLQVSSQLQIAREKQNRFNTSNQLLNQELFKINQAIVNHFITINALEMARDDLLPLISSEILIAQGNKDANSSLELSKNIMDLFKAMLERNVDSTKEVLTKINSIYSLNGTTELLNMHINNYINTIDNTTDKENSKKLIKEI